MNLAMSAYVKLDRQGERARAEALAESFREGAALRTGKNVSRLIGMMREAREGSADAKEFLALSAMGEEELRERLLQGKDVSSAQRSAAMEDIADDTYDKFYRAKMLSQGRRHLIDRGIAAVRRELGRLGAKPDDLPDLERLIGAELCSEGAEDSEQTARDHEESVGEINGSRPKDS